MEKVIDKLTSETGYTLTNASFIGINEHREAIAGWQTKSLIFGFNEIGATVSKSITSLSTSGYDYIVFSCWSRTKNRLPQKVDDYEFSVNFGNGKRYFQPTNTMRQVIIPVSSDSTITEITFEREGDTSILCVSYMVLAKTEIPLDCFVGIQDSINRKNRPLAIPQTVTADLGDTSISGDYDYISRYAVVRIYDTTNSETHEVQDYSNGVMTFTDGYDGIALLHDYVAANIEMLYIVQYGTTEDRIIMPSITIWGMGETPDGDSNEEDTRIVGATDTLYWITKDNKSQNLNIQIVISAESYQQIGEMKRIVEEALRERTIWINGMKHEMIWDSATVPIEPSDPVAILPENIYNVTVSVREALWQTIETKKTTSQTLTVELQDQP